MPCKDVFEKAGELISEKKFSEAVNALTKVDVEKLTAEEQKELGDLFEVIPESNRQASATHCLQEMQLAGLLGGFKNIERWYGRLVQLRESCKEGSQARGALEDSICIANIIRPGCDNARLLLMMAVLYHEGAGCKVPCYISFTARTPSILRGRKDLSDWSQNTGAVISILMPMLEKLHGEDARGISECARAEILYERGDAYGALQALAGTLSIQDPEIFFVSHALLAKLKLLSPNGQKPEEIADSIESMIKEKEAVWLQPNFKAFKAWLSLKGDGKYAAEWAKTEAPNELEGLTPRDFYASAVKAQVYLSQGRSEDAVTLAGELIELLKNDYRPLDSAECTVLMAAACESAGQHDTAMSKLAEALEITENYGFTSIYSDYGTTLESMLEEYIGRRTEENGSAYHGEKVLQFIKLTAQPEGKGAEKKVPEKKQEAVSEEKAPAAEKMAAEEKQKEDSEENAPEKEEKAPEEKPEPKKKPAPKKKKK